MKVLRLYILFVLFSVLTIALCTGSMSPGSPDKSAPETGAKKTARNGSPDGFVAYKDSILFPQLADAHVTAISLSTPQRSFEFQCSNPASVIVNGYEADEDVFSILLSQIRQMPVDTAASFVPADAPSLTLVISTLDGAQHTAHFYASGHSGTPAHISSGPDDAPLYYSTDAWRIGTLMMTCEGTRIQDASGKEIPAG